MLQLAQVNEISAQLSGSCCVLRRKQCQISSYGQRCYINAPNPDVLNNLPRGFRHPVRIPAPPGWIPPPLAAWPVRILAPPAAWAAAADSVPIIFALLYSNLQRSTLEHTTVRIFPAGTTCSNTRLYA